MQVAFYDFSSLWDVLKRDFSGHRVRVFGLQLVHVRGNSLCSFLLTNHFNSILMTLVPDLTLQFLKWRFKHLPGATQAYGWIHEDIDRLGWHGWLTAQDRTLVEERELRLMDHNRWRAEQLCSEVSTLELLVQSGVHPPTDAFRALRQHIEVYSKQHERLAATLLVYHNVRQSITFLTRLHKRTPRPSERGD